MKEKTKDPITNGEPVNRLPEIPASKAKPKDTEIQKIVIAPIEIKLMQITIEGITPLIVHNWSEKARKEMRDKQQKKANKAREAKDPQAEYLAALYTHEEGWTGIPASGVKGCLVNACRMVNGLPMTLAKRMLYVHADATNAKGQDLVRVYGEHEMHEANVRLESGTADLRYRPIYKKWEIPLTIQYIANVVSAEQVANLINMAGMCEGLCEHRPGSPKSNTGTNGMFKIREG